MDKIILLTLLSLIGSVTIGNAQLQCHVCRNCPNPNELDSYTLEQCSLQTTTTTTTTSTTTTPPEDTTTPPTDTTTPPTDTTVPPIDTTLPPTDTPLPPTDTTFPPTDTTLPPSPPPTDTTVDGPIITTQPPPVTPPSTTPQIPVSPPEFSGRKFVQRVRQSLEGFQCFVVHQTVGDSVQVNRGCVPIQETSDQTCSDANEGEDPEFCRLCAYDGCNGGTKYAVSLVILLSSLFVTFTIR
ncbi:salivary glue protein Sgs-3-like [Bradysia coprophila]|uniref:salivary glue protein Sgs-3-like n=1 Tax=Bradysia coprophila TaxID=38358 RepID=UPI00187DD975|nr:salivary glue protein Sgs-3-like [Bradysia coprophila]